MNYIQENLSPHKEILITKGTPQDKAKETLLLIPKVPLTGYIIDCDWRLN